MKTTVEISNPLLERAKKIAARDRTTLRSLVEEGLRAALAARSEAEPELPPFLVVDGNGLTAEFQNAGWDQIRDAIYEGRGT